MKKLIYLIITGFILAGCSDVRYALPTLDKSAKAFHPQANHAALYIFHNVSGDLPVIINGKKIGIVNSKTYLHGSIAEGSYTISHPVKSVIPIEIEASPGNLYFVKFTAGWNTSYFEEVPHELGIEEVLKRKATVNFAKIRPDTRIGVQVSE